MCFLLICLTLTSSGDAWEPEERIAATYQRRRKYLIMIFLKSKKINSNATNNHK